MIKLPLLKRGWGNVLRIRNQWCLCNQGFNAIIESAIAMMVNKIFV